MSTAAWGRDGPCALVAPGLVSFGSGEDQRRAEAEGPSSRVPGPASAGRGPERRPTRLRLLLLALAVLLLALLALAALVVWRSIGDELSGTSIARDTIESGSEPRVRLTNAAGPVRVEGVEDLGSIEYEVTRYAVASDPVAAKRRASEVPIDVTREDSTVVMETDGGRGTGADYLLRVPAGGSVEVESGAGDVEVSGLSGGVTVAAEAGDVTVRNAGSNVTVEVPQGDVAVGDVNTDTGQVGLEVGTGDVTLQDMIVGTMELHVEAGDVALSGRFSGSGRVLVETGDITASLPPEDTRELTLETRVGEVVRETPSGDEARPEQGA